MVSSNGDFFDIRSRWFAHYPVQVQDLKRSAQQAADNSGKPQLLFFLFEGGPGPLRIEPDWAKYRLLRGR